MLQDTLFSRAKDLHLTSQGSSSFTCTCLRCRCSSIGSSSVMNMVVNVVSVCCSSQGKMARIRICRKIITVGRSEFCHTKIIEILPENIKITKIYHTEHILRRCHEKVCQCTKYIVAQIHKKQSQGFQGRQYFCCYFGKLMTS